MNEDLDGEPRRAGWNDLDCIVCGRWFATFARLAAHMAARHGAPTPNSADDVELPPVTGRDGSGFFSKDQRMAKKRTTRKIGASTNSGRVPAPSKDAPGSLEFNPFLKVKDIGRGKIGDEAILTLTGENRLVDGAFGEQLVCEVKIGRESFDWGVTIDSVNHRLLYDRFGANPKKWRGKVPVTIKMSRQNRPYVAAMRTRAVKDA